MNKKNNDKDLPNKKDKESDKLSSLVPSKRIRESYDKLIKEVDNYIQENPNGLLEARRIKILESIPLDFSPFSKVKQSTNLIVNRLINQFSENIFEEIEGIKGKEEDISSSLSEKITESLVGEYKSQFDGKKIGDYKFKIKTQKKIKQEPYTGADLIGFCTVKHGEKEINKYFLLQAKVGERRDDGTFYAKDPRILKQAEKMINITSSSFFIVYTTQGFEIVSAMNVYAYGKNEIDTRTFKGIAYEDFNNSVLDCFTGDMKLERPEWKSYLIDPLNTPVPFDESLLHILVSKTEGKNIQKKK